VYAILAEAGVDGWASLGDGRSWAVEPSQARC
jgi:hypothetical protein